MSKYNIQDPAGREILVSDKDKETAERMCKRFNTEYKYAGPFKVVEKKEKGK